MPTPELMYSTALSEIGVPHAFTTRRGGFSVGVFDSLNFGNPGELPPEVLRDSKETIAKNFELLARTIDASDRRIVQVHQVHGDHVHVERDGADCGERIIWGDVKADAIVTDSADCLIAIRTADCTPILLSSTDGRVVASVHAGWRGVISGVTLRAIDRMRELGATRIIGAIGPCIGRDSFEVGSEVVEIFRSRFGDKAPVRTKADGKGFVDLKECLRLQIESELEQLEILPHCTVKERDLFFSHRRDGGVTGRMVGVIGCAPRKV
ncbi:MAG: peptidoglycan editing factor PgeF [Phycisphaerales bacterium]